jgi:Gluconate 2-dehydrogenase subunit 3
MRARSFEAAGHGLSRRAFLRAGAIAGAALALPLRFSERALAALRPSFLTDAERRTLAALQDRILPPDHDPGADALGCVDYVETLLTAFDGADAFVFAGGPFSGRSPFADRRGRRSDRRVRNAFRTPLPLTRLQELAWRTDILGSAAAGLPAALTDQRSGPIEGLRDVYRQGLTHVEDVALSSAGRSFHLLSPAAQDELLPVLDGAAALVFPGRGESFMDIAIRHVLEGCFAPPEYGGNRGGRGWKMIGIEGDSQPFGYSVYRAARGDYRERRRHPMSTPNPDEVGPGGAVTPRPLSEDGLALQDTIADLADFLGNLAPGACR